MSAELIDIASGDTNFSDVSTGQRGWESGSEVLALRCWDCDTQGAGPPSSRNRENWVFRALSD
jgi:hypothetical protein